MTLRLMVALDDSPWAEAAGEAALALAGALRREVLLSAVHVVNVAHASGHLLKDLAALLGFEPVLVPEDAERVFIERGEHLLAQFKARCEAAGFVCDTYLEQGAVLDCVLRRGAAADLLVLGTRGETALRYPMHSGTAERLVKRLTVPCLLVPRGGLDLSRVNLAYDGTEGGRVALRVAGHLAEWSEIGVQVLYVDDGRRRAGAPAEEALQHLRRAGIEATARLVEGEPHEALAAAVRPGEILVVGYRGRSGLRGWLLGRVTERLLGEPQLALLVAR